MDHVWLKLYPEANAARFRHVRNYEDSFELLEGMPLADSFPADAEYRMNNEYPEDLGLTDLLYNLDDQLVVSARVRELFEARGVPHVEYLDVRVINHKGRKVRERYSVVNLLRHADCIDRNKTKLEWNTLDPEQLSDFEDLTIDEGKIEPSLQLLRVKHMPWPIVARRDLAEQMVQLGFSGFRIAQIAEYEL